MRYRKPSSHGDSLGQFFTPQPIAALLARELRKVPTSVLELGAGEGALIAAVLQRHPGLSATLVEVEKRLAKRLRSSFPGQLVHSADVLQQTEQLPLNGSYSTVIGNPPFGEFDAEKGKHLQLRSLFPGCDRGGWIRQDLAFLYESWRRLAPGGELSFILASPIISDPSFTEVRRWLFSEASRVSIFELPEDIFEGAEVGTYLMTIGHRGKGRRASHASLDRYLDDGTLQGQLSVPMADVIERADFRYHEIRQRAGQHWSGDTTLSTLGAEVIRGSRSHREFAVAGVRHLHTSDFTDNSNRLHLGKSNELGVRLAECGDILVPRVGTRCLLRQAIIASGARPITEAVFRIRVARKHRTRVFDAISGDAGRLWRTAHARGSCAKFLTVPDILRMPV